MKRIGTFLTLLFGVSVIAAPLRGQDSTVIAEEVVAVVGSSMILWSEVAQNMDFINQMQREQGYTSNRDPRCEALEALLLQKLLSNQAKLDSLSVEMSSVEMMVEAEVSRIIEEYGSLLAVESAFRKPVYQIRDVIRERYTDMMLAQNMENTVKNKIQITPSEVERFYRRINRDSLPIVPDQYVYAQIVMYPPSMEEAKLRARERLLELRQRIIEGQNFGTLARVYSVDPGSAMRGGEYDFMSTEGLQRPFSEALEKLRVGQISSVVETEDGFHIIELLEKKGNLYRFRHILIKPEFTVEELTETAIRLDSLADAIRAGELTFDQAALRYSQDDYTKYNGGEVTNREIVEYYQADVRQTSNRFFREELQGDYEAIRPLRPGEISPSYATQDLRGNQQVKIVLLKEIVPAHRANINDDYSSIEDMAIFDKQTREYDDWLRKKIAAMYVRIDPKYTGCDFEYDWVK